MVDGGPGLARVRCTTWTGRSTRWSAANGWPGSKAWSPRMMLHPVQRPLPRRVDVRAGRGAVPESAPSSRPDVVQSVGRVMRKSYGRTTGTSSCRWRCWGCRAVCPRWPTTEAQFKVVWQALNALRSARRALRRDCAERETGRPVKGSDKHSGDTSGPTSTRRKPAVAEQLAMFSLSQWQEAIYARIVDRLARTCGSSGYRCRRHRRDADHLYPRPARRRRRYGGGGVRRILAGLRDINDSITPDDAISVAAPDHQATVFDALFAGHDFASHSRAARRWSTPSGCRPGGEAARLEGFYESVRRRAGEVWRRGQAAGDRRAVRKFFRIGFRSRPGLWGSIIRAGRGRGLHCAGG